MGPLPAGKDVEVFFDGACPLCMREIRMLRRLDARAKIQFTDIAAASFDAAQLGTTQAELMARIQGRDADGRWLEGVDVFRALYAAVGFRRLVAVSRLPAVRQLLSAGYRLFAANRLRLTGRCTDAHCEISGATARS